jgi:tyrosine-protein kinase Etk/Wzc
MGPNFEMLTKNLSDTYDLVIFDTPPILAVTDASIIGSYCSQNMMVSRFGLSSSKEVLAAKNRFNLNGIDISGVIFNAIQKKASSYYYDDIFAYSSAVEGYYKTPIENQSSE